QNEMEKKDFIEQLNKIILLLMESLRPYFKHREFIKILRTARTENGYQNFLWERLKEQLDHMSKFPMSPTFVWRANRYFAHSSIVMPIASTSIQESAPNVGFLILGFRNVIENSKGQFVHLTHDQPELLKEFIYTIRSLYGPLIHPFMDKIYYGQIVNNSVRDSIMGTGVAKVMSRNLSHNIGSNILERISRERLDNDYTVEDYHVFHSYLRTRMGFIADVSVGKPHLIVTHRLKANLLNMFLKDEAEKSNDQYNRFQKILFDNISGLENYKSDNIKVKFANKKDIDVTIPNSRLGAHALYIIIENVIRNAFKHSNIKDELAMKEGLEFTIDYRRSEHGILSGFYELIIKDNLGKHYTQPEAQGQKQDREQERRRDQKLVDRLQDMLEEPIFNSNKRELSLENLGFTEMKIAAAYLLQVDMSQIDKKVMEPTGEKLIRVEIDEEKNMLFRFYVQAPQELEIVQQSANDFFDNLGAVDNHLQERGIKVRMPKKDEIWHKSDYSVKVIIRDTHSHLGITDDALNAINVNTHRIVIIDKGTPAFEQLKKKLQDYEDKQFVYDVLNHIWKQRTLALVEENNPKKSVSESEKNKFGYRDLSILLWGNSTTKNYRWPNFTNDLATIEESLKKNGLVSNFQLKEFYHRENGAPRVYEFANTREAKKQLRFSINFDNHGNGIPNALLNLRENNYSLYYESFYSQDPTTFILGEIISEKNRFYRQEELIEMAFTDIGILDERIQDEFETKIRLYSKGDKNAPHRLMDDSDMEVKRIFIPRKVANAKETERVDLGQASFMDKKGIKQKIKKWIDQIPERNQERELDFLIIHTTLVEKIVNSNPERALDFIHWLNPKLNPNYRAGQEAQFMVSDVDPPKRFDGQVILTSGKGKPRNIADHIPFIPYSVVKRFLFEQPSKINLTRTLFAAAMKTKVKK
ncbi:MAG: hypothetical protein AAF985_22165, partial [Bacteroidota bacterium]